jgi:hypothetical protein
LKTFFDYPESDDGLAEFIDDLPYLKTQTMKFVEVPFNL